MTKFYEIKVPIERPDVKKHWMRIGSGTEFTTEWGAKGIACTMETAPLNWQGAFFIFPSKEKPAAEQPDKDKDKDE
jgi:hypothetical protein